MIFLDLARFSAISFAASILLNSKNPFPDCIDFEIKLAASLSPFKFEKY